MPVVNAVKCDQVKDDGCNRNGNRDSHQDDIYRPKQIGCPCGKWKYDHHNKIEYEHSHIKGKKQYRIICLFP